MNHLVLVGFQAACGASLEFREIIEARIGAWVKCAECLGAFERGEVALVTPEGHNPPIGKRIDDLLASDKPLFWRPFPEALASIPKEVN